ncbi:hypothetical protein QQP08_015490 [Theobroma cacao]|nr:hypothetical protein QQP08_015490 [Theobroma cacao]
MPDASKSLVLPFIQTKRQRLAGRRNEITTSSYPPNLLIDLKLWLLMETGQKWRPTNIFAYDFVSFPDFSSAQNKLLDPGRGFNSMNRGMMAPG